jgi:stearoyl-CoA desaturase (Delta-9 desaturase)
VADHSWRRFVTGDESPNVGWLSRLTFGESRPSHAFPPRAFHGLSRGKFDPGGLFIRGLDQVGLASAR